MAFDENSGVFVMFGGSSGIGALSADTWTWDEAAGWTLPPEAAIPDARTGAAMAYEKDRGRILLFGGEDKNGSKNAETWEWDAGDGWFQFGGPENVGPPISPSPRAGHSMSYDPLRGVVLLVGDGGNGSIDSWEWDGDVISWTNRTPQTGAIPPSRSGAGLAFDKQRGTTILFGGVSTSTAPAHNLGDTWEWDGDAGTWTLLVPDGNGPPARSLHTMIADSLRGSIVVFGGVDDSVGHFALNDAWEWDGSTATWTKVSATLLPAPRMAAAAAFDESNGRLLLYGGVERELGLEGPFQGLGAVLGDTVERVVPTRPAFLWSVPFDASGLSANNVKEIAVRATANAGASLSAWDARGGGSFLPLASTADSTGTLAFSVADAAAQGLLTGAKSTLSVAVVGAPASVDLDDIEARFSVDLSHAVARAGHDPLPRPPTPYQHTIPLSGSNAFNDALEGFDTTTPGDRIYVSWDADNLYVGFSGDIAGLTSSADASLIVDIDPAPGSGDGAAFEPSAQIFDQGSSVQIDDARVTAMPAGFSARFSIGADLAQSGGFGVAFDGEQWTPLPPSAPVDATTNGVDFAALSIPRAAFGLHTKLSLIAYVSVFARVTLAARDGIFAGSFTDGSPRVLRPTRFLKIDFTSSQAPNAPASAGP
jgi:hypothetical protein